MADQETGRIVNFIDEFRAKLPADATDGNACKSIMTAICTLHISR